MAHTLLLPYTLDALEPLRPRSVSPRQAPQRLASLNKAIEVDLGKACLSGSSKAGVRSSGLGPSSAGRAWW